MKRVVVKIGSSSLTNSAGRLSSSSMVELTRQLAYMHRQEVEVIVVSSGAVAAGKQQLEVRSQEMSSPLTSSKQMIAAVGQAHLMRLWSELFSLYGLTIGQLLLTRDDFHEPTRADNTSNTFRLLLQHRIIPIVNENDSIVTEENRIGDNDTLSGMIAQLVGADLLILLTDQLGLYTADPRLHPEATLIESIHQIDEVVQNCAGDSSHPGRIGVGGMTTKLAAAKGVTGKGIPVKITSSREPNILIDLLSGKKIGTTIHPRKET